jgi:hypothetical protein
MKIIVSEAVQLFKEIIEKEKHLKHVRDELRFVISKMSEENMRDYLRITKEIRKKET